MCYGDFWKFVPAVDGITKETSETKLDGLLFSTFKMPQKKIHNINLFHFFADFFLYSKKIWFCCFFSFVYDTLKVSNGVNLSESIREICHHYWKVWLIIPPKLCLYIFKDRKKKTHNFYMKSIIRYAYLCLEMLKVYPL